MTDPSIIRGHVSIAIEGIEAVKSNVRSGSLLDRDIAFELDNAKQHLELVQRWLLLRAQRENVTSDELEASGKAWAI